MPLYEYKCPACEHVVETIQKIDDPAPKCDRCENRPAMIKQTSTSTSFRLKGSGWYQTGA